LLTVRRWLWICSSVLVLLSACHGGAPAGVGTTCDEETPCRPFLVCSAGTCQPKPQSERDAGSDGSSVSSDGPALGGDAPAEAPAAIPADAGPTEGAATDAAPGHRSANDQRGSDQQPGPIGPNDLLASFDLFAASEDARLFWWRAPVVYGSAWQNMGDITVDVGNIGRLNELDAQGELDGSLHLLGRVLGKVHHAVRRGGQWEKWRELPVTAGSIDLTEESGRVTACVLTPGGRVQLATLTATGWGGFEDVTDRALPPAPAVAARRIACLYSRGDLLLFISDDRGALWSAVRTSSWTAAVRFMPAGNLVLDDADLAVAAGEVHLLGHGPEGQFHSMRRFDRTWTPLLNLQLETGVPGGTINGSATAAVGTETQYARMLSGRQIQRAARFRDGTFHAFEAVTSSNASPYTAITLVGSTR
jgi:hypothetical protein